MPNRLGPKPLPSTAELCAYVWHHLETHHDCRPKQADLAAALGFRSRQLRRRWKDTGHPKVRNMITYGCLSYGLWLVHAEQCKATAAMRQAGFKNYWDANRQCRKYTGRTVGRCRAKFMFTLDAKEAFAKLEQLRGRGQPPKENEN